MQALAGSNSTGEVGLLNELTLCQQDIAKHKKSQWLKRLSSKWSGEGPVGS